MPDSHPEYALDKVRTLCQELALRHRLSDAMRNELCAHLEDKLAGYLGGTLPVTEEDALFLVRAHFGDAGQIARQIARDPTDTFLSFRVDHARLYSILLVLLGVSTALTIPLGLVVYTLRRFSGAPSTSSHIPNWLLPWSAAIGGAYLTVIIVTLCARRLNPPAGRRLTRFLNYALLAAPPFGTLLGIYGLTKVDVHPHLHPA